MFGSFWQFWFHVLYMVGFFFRASEDSSSAIYSKVLKKTQVMLYISQLWFPQSSLKVIRAILNNITHRNLNATFNVCFVISPSSQKSSATELHDYENVSSACAPKLPLANTDWESDTSDEEEVKYTAVSVKPGLRKPKEKRSSSSSTTSSEEDRTLYSDIKT